MKAVVALAVFAALGLSACATGGPAGGQRARCAGDQGGDPSLRPMVFVFCLESP